MHFRRRKHELAEGMPSVMRQHATKERGIVAVDVIGKTSARTIETSPGRRLPGWMLAGVPTAAICCVLSMGWSSQAGASDCASLIASFEEALKKRDIPAAEAVEKQLSVDAVCGVGSVKLQHRLASAELSMAEDFRKDPLHQQEREKLLIKAEKYSVSWAASYALGEFHFAQRKFAEAAREFESAIDIANDKSFTPKPTSAEEKKTLFDRASEAKLLAANEENNKTATYVSSPKTRAGTIGGVLTASERGVVATLVPLPINFETNETRFTDIGQKAIDELGQALVEQHPQEIVLIGHTDERGDDEYNMRLSKARVQAVVKYLSGFLAQHNVSMDVRAEWKGKRQPIHLEDTNGLTQTDIWALNRRVELKRQ
jgi:outer membrane protein OmpA-like peptidoglycan-associated protein